MNLNLNSISKILDKKSKLKLLSLVLVLALVSLSYFFIIGKNPKKSRAAYQITTDRVINNSFDGATDLSNQDVYIWNHATVTMYGVNHFKSLTIYDDAVVTHEALTTSDFGTSMPFAVTQTGANKKVDITVDDYLFLNSFGKIDVSGKGYPGGRLGGSCVWANNGSYHVQGYGPGPGESAWQWGSPGNYNARGGGGAGAGGGSTWGRGGLPYGQDYYLSNSRGSLTGQPVVYNAAPQYGNGGGAAKGGGTGDCADPAVNGGAGGGVIILNVGKTLSIAGFGSSITADGNSGECADPAECTGQAIPHHQSNVYGGGGGGGWIQITANGFNTTALNSGVYADAGAGNDAIGPGTFLNLAPGVANGHISASGGAGLTGSDQGGGGGGTVILKLTGRYLTKVLTPISRPGASPASNFNPYALQAGDVILVTITVSGMSSGVNFFLEDPYLKTYDNAHKCASPTNVTPAALVTDANVQAWQFSQDTVVSYQCTVN